MFFLLFNMFAYLVSNFDCLFLSYPYTMRYLGGQGCIFKIYLRILKLVGAQKNKSGVVLGFRKFRYDF